VTILMVWISRAVARAACRQSGGCGWRLRWGALCGADKPQHAFQTRFGERGLWQLALDVRPVVRSRCGDGDCSGSSDRQRPASLPSPGRTVRPPARAFLGRRARCAERSARTWPIEGRAAASRRSGYLRQTWSDARSGRAGGHPSRQSSHARFGLAMRALTVRTSARLGVVHLRSHADCSGTLALSEQRMRRHETSPRERRSSHPHSGVADGALLPHALERGCVDSGCSTRTL
jgi:hypothetical protein